MCIYDVWGHLIYHSSSISRSVVEYLLANVSELEFANSEGIT